MAKRVVYAIGRQIVPSIVQPTRDALLQRFSQPRLDAVFEDIGEHGHRDERCDDADVCCDRRRVESEVPRRQELHADGPHHGDTCCEAKQEVLDHVRCAVFFLIEEEHFGHELL